MQTSPDPTELKKFAWYHISGNWHHIKAAPLAFGSVGAVSFVLGFLLASQLLLASKNATIESLRTANEISSKESEKLSRQISEIKTSRGDSGLPLKKKALLLTRQIKEFTAAWKDSDSEAVINDNVNNYLARFGLRAQLIRDELDQIGYHSDTFDRVIYSFNSSYADVRTIAAEIEKLSQRLSD